MEAGKIELKRIFKVVDFDHFRIHQDKPKRKIENLPMEVLKKFLKKS